MKKNIGLLFLGLAAMFDYQTKSFIIDNKPQLTGAQYIGNGGTLAFGQPIFFPKKHTKQTYRSQQRAAKQRRKQR